jgi:hypothetical protein
MANSYIPKWQNISVNFNDANSMMDTAIGGISKAGTVFGKLRDDIAAEEQRAAEAAYKQQVFDENVRQFELEQAWNRENAIATRAHDKEMEGLRAENETKRINLQHNNAIALQRAKQEFDEKDDKEKAKLHADSRAMLDTLLQNGVPFAVASDMVDQHFIRASNGRYAYDPTLVYTPEQYTTLNTIRSPRNRAQQDFDDKLEAGTRIADAQGFRLRLDPKSNAANPDLISLSERIRNIDGETVILDEKTGLPRALSEQEKALYQQYNEGFRKEANTYNFLDSKGITEDQAKTWAKQKTTAEGLYNLRNETALARGADPETVGDKSITTNAETAAARKKAMEEAATKSAIAKMKDSESSAYTDQLVKYAGQTINIGKGKDESAKRLVSEKYQGASLAMAEMFAEYKVPASQLELFLTRMRSKEEEDANSYISSDPMEVAKKYGEAVINSYLEKQGKATITLDVKNKKFVDAAKRKAEDERKKVEAAAALKDGRQKAGNSDSNIILQPVYQDIKDRESRLNTEASTVHYPEVSSNVTPEYKTEKLKLITEMRAVADALKNGKPIDFAGEDSLKKVRETIRKAYMGAKVSTTQLTREQDENADRWLRLIDDALKAKKNKKD